MNAAGITLSKSTGEILEDVEFRNTETNTPLEVVYVRDSDFWGYYRFLMHILKDTGYY